MNSSVAKKEIFRYTFPCLLIHENKKEEKSFIVLFTEKSSGTVVYKEKNCMWNLGEYKENWIIESFELFYGEIKLSN